REAGSLRRRDGAPRPHLTRVGGKSALLTRTGGPRPFFKASREDVPRFSSAGQRNCDRTPRHLRTTPYGHPVSRDCTGRLPDAGADRHLVAASHRRGNLAAAHHRSPRSLLAHRQWLVLAESRMAVADAVLRGLSNRRPRPAHGVLRRG